MNITVTGSIAYDYLMTFPGKFSDYILPDQLHQISLSFLVESMQKMRGGTAPNIAFTLGLLGGRPLMMATAGDDFGTYRQWLDAHGVDTSGTIEIENEHCASFFVNTDNEQNQIATFYTGAMAYAGKLSFDEHAPHTDLAIISPNDPVAMMNYVRECKASGIDYIYDPSQQTIWLSGDDLREGLEGCAMLTVNEYEFGMIRDKTKMTEAEILKNVQAVLITKGKEGSLLKVNGGDTYHIPIVPLHRSVDPTGAGDAFRAGLLRGMQLKLPWELSGRMGALAAAFVLEEQGTQGHSYTPGQFVERFRTCFDDDGQLDILLNTPSPLADMAEAGD
ncbi:MAG: carbohydrate kinase family protein [Ardenticatenaceae bacterium]|nr:carbohydrate kinase family protein [Ardenticatenaceae bacterium]